MARRHGPKWFFLVVLLVVWSGHYFSGASRVNLFTVVSQVDGWLVGSDQGVQAAGLVETPPVGRVPLPIPMIMGYYYAPVNSPNAVADLQHYRNLLTGIVPFWYTVAANGTITGEKDNNVLNFAHQNHMFVFALIQNMAGAAVFHPLLNDPAATDKAVRGILGILQGGGFDGVNLDFEGIAPGDREAFTAFVVKLGAVLHQKGYYLTLSIPAKTQENPANSWSGAYDYAALGQAADLIMPMAYDQHSSGGSPGPIASQRWVQDVTAYAVSQIPPSKLVLGIPAYGYSWAPWGVAEALSYGQADALAKAYGANPSMDHLEYYQGGVWHQVWYENLGTFLQKVGVVTGYSLRGIVLWRLGIEDPQIWQAIDPNVH